MYAVQGYTANLCGFPHTHRAMNFTKSKDIKKAEFSAILTSQCNFEHCKPTQFF